MHGDCGALIHRNRHGVLTHVSVMGLQGGILYSCNPITIYFLGNIFAETYKLIREYILLLGSRIGVYFIPRPPCSGAAAQ